jgi:hypothetical protein
MKARKSLGLTLAGCGLLAAAPAAFAGEDASLQDRIQQLERQVQELKGQLGRAPAADDLSIQVDRYLASDEKGELWRDRHGAPLSKAVKSIWIQGSARFRPEYWDNFADLTNTLDDTGLQTFTRYRLGVGANLNGGQSVFMELNMAGSWGNTAVANDAGFMIAPTLYQGYVTGLFSDCLGMDTKIGRFELVEGDEYLLGDRDFSQTGLAHDGVVLSKDWKDNSFKADIFFTKEIEGFKGAGVDRNLYMMGIYGNWYGSESKTGMTGGMEPYYILLKDQTDTRGPGGTTRDVHTLGVRWHGDKSTKDEGGLFWNSHLNVQQSGDTGYSVDATAGYRMSKSNYSPTLWGQFHRSSGDKDGPGSGTYNPLFIDAHGRYGYSDMFAPGNLQVLGAGVEIAPKADLTYGLSARYLSTVRTTKPVTGVSGKRLGWEFDFYVKHKCNENVALEAAWATVQWQGNQTAALDDVHRAYVNLVVSF